MIHLAQTAIPGSSFAFFNLYCYAEIDFEILKIRYSWAVLQCDSSAFLMSWEAILDEEELA